MGFMGKNCAAIASPKASAASRKHSKWRTQMDLAGEQPRSVNQEEKYKSAVNRIIPPGPTMWMLTSCMNATDPDPQLSKKQKRTEFTVLRDDGKVLIAEVQVNGFYDQGPATDRVHLRIWGTLCSTHEPLRRADSRDTKQLVEIVYNVKDHTGTLHIMTNERPGPSTSN
jgi:hypothetical protein